MNNTINTQKSTLDFSKYPENMMPTIAQDVDYVSRIIVAKINTTLRDQGMSPITTSEIEAEIIRRRK